MRVSDYLQNLTERYSNFTSKLSGYEEQATSRESAKQVSTKEEAVKNLWQASYDFVQAGLEARKVFSPTPYDTAKEYPALGRRVLDATSRIVNEIILK